MLKTVSLAVTVLVLLVWGTVMFPGADQEGLSGTWRLRVRLGDHGGGAGSLVLTQDGERVTFAGTIQDRTISGTCDDGAVGGAGTWEAARQQSAWDVR